MPRFNQPSQGDEPIQIELDERFAGGVNNWQPLDKLAPGEFADAVNMRLVGDEPMTRPGLVQPVHFNGFVSLPWLAAGVFSDPLQDGLEWILAAQIDTIWMMADGQTPLPLAIASGQSVTGPAQFVQCFNQVVLFRGPALTPLIWSGDRRDPWRPASDSAYDPDRARFLSPIPQADYGVVMADRLFVPISRDTVAWSDILDPTAFDLVLNTVRCNKGEDDAIVALAPYQGNRLIVFKTQSIYFVEGVTGDMGGMSVDRLPVDELGCVSRHTVAAVGNDMMWLSAKGVYRLGQTDNGGLRILPTPTSQPVHRWIQRINWRFASQCRATVAGDYYLLSVPLDGAEENTATLVYNLVQQRWEGIDYYGGAPSTARLSVSTSGTVEAGDPIAGGLNIGESHGTRSLLATGFLLTTDLDRRRTAYFISGTKIFALQHEPGSPDRIDSAERPIYSRWLSRGYRLASLRVKRLQSVTPMLATRNAEITTAVVTDGPNERIDVRRGRRRNRFRYTRHGRPDWQPSNAADNFAAPYREDYTWHAIDGTQPRSGIPLVLWQTWQDGHAVRRMGRWFAVAVESVTGQIAIQGLQLDGTADRNALHSQS